MGVGSSFHPRIRIVAALLLLVVFATGCGASEAAQVRSYLDANYEQIDNEALDGGRNDTRTYRSDRDVPTTVGEIEAAVQPRERANNDAGSYLQYPDVVVAVQPPAEGEGSVVTLDDDEYARRRFPFIAPLFIPIGGGRGFGRSSGGSGGTVRGGGPGFGK